MLIMRTITAVFDSHHKAVTAATRVRDTGLRTDDISVIAPNHGDDSHYEDISEGALKGGILGGAIGLLLGAGAVAIPGIGAIAAAGPITGLITGTLTGGLVGALVDLGIPEFEAQEYQTLLSQGKTIWTMRVTEDYYPQVRDVLYDCGAERVS